MIASRLLALFGLFVMIGLAWLLSSHKRSVSLRILVGGLLLQFALAIVLLLTPPGQWLFDGINFAFAKLDEFKNVGAEFVFGIEPWNDAEKAKLPPGYTLMRAFAFNVLPTIIVFASLMSILYFLGVMQWIVKVLAKLMQFTLGTSGAESLSAAANIFVGHTEAPLVVRPYISGMTTSELNAMMVGGFATISGGLLALYHGMGIDAGHLVTASVISAPAALLIAKVMQPEVDTPDTLGTVKVEIPRRGANILEAASIGATDGMTLAFNVAAMLIAFLALIAMINAIIGGVGSWFGQTWSLELFLRYAFAPFAWLMGIESRDCLAAGELLGLKMVANELIAYKQLGEWTADNSAIEISKRSQHILTYALSGFSNFAAIGIQIGGIGGLAPDRRSDLARLGLRAMIGGALACCMTACIAGILI